MRKAADRADRSTIRDRLAILKADCYRYYKRHEGDYARLSTVLGVGGGVGGVIGLTTLIEMFIDREAALAFFAAAVVMALIAVWRVKGDINGRQHVYRVRFARAGEAHDIYKAANEAFNFQIPVEEPNVMRRWLRNDNHVFRVVETVAYGKRQQAKIRGYYSVFPMTEAAYTRLRTGKLYYTDIDSDAIHPLAVFVMRDNEHPVGYRLEDRIYLFVLDFLTSGRGMVNYISPLLTVDLLWHIQMLLRSYPQIAGVGTLVWNTEGAAVADMFGLQPDVRFRDPDHPDWKFFHIDRGKIENIMSADENVRNICEDNRFAPLYETDSYYYSHICVLKAPLRTRGRTSGPAILKRIKDRIRRRRK